MHYYDNGQLKLKIQVKNGTPDGLAESYYEDGKIRYKEYFNEGRLLNGISFSKGGQRNTYEMNPTVPFPSGGHDKFYQYIEKNNELKSDTLDKMVVVRFDVHETGKLSNFRLLQSIGDPYDEYAIELISSGPSWYPARSHGLEEISTYTEVSVEF